jgi:hypothetical protein
MKDRTIDVSNTLVEGHSYDTYRRGALYKSENRTMTMVGAYVRKRVPSADVQTKPEKEKSFLHKTLTVNPVRGTFNTVGASSNIYRYRYKGTLSYGSYNSGGNTLFTNMAFPYGANGNNPSVDTPLNPDLLSQAEVKALNKLRDKTEAADIDFGLWWAERHETIRLFRDGAVGVLKLAQSIAKKDWRRSAQVLRDAFGVPATLRGERARVKRLEKWIQNELRRGRKVPNRVFKQLEDMVLTYNLGISPLLQDLQAAHLAMQRATLPDGMRIKAVSRHSRHRQDVDRVKLAEYPEGRIDTVTTFVEDHGYTVTLIACPLDTDIAKFQRLGLTNPPATLYQATRLTFILDYFYALGPYLESMTVPLGFRWLDGSWSQKVTRNVTFEVTSPNGGLAKGGYSLISHERKVYANWPAPIPPLSLREKQLSAKQAINTGLIALKSFRSLIGG